MAEQNAQNQVHKKNPPIEPVDQTVLFFFGFQSQSSPRRVAVPVLVKDGKPCSGTNESGAGGNARLVGSSSQSPQSGGHCAHSPGGLASQAQVQQHPHQQHSQQGACSSTASILTNMAYQRQMGGQQHHQQPPGNICSSYLPLQGRAW